MKAMGRITAVVAVVMAAGCAKESATAVSQESQPTSPAQEPSAASVEVVQIHWSSSNPSLGPYERTSRATVGPGDFESPQAWSAVITTLLDDTQVNGVATLREYLVAKRDQDAVRVATIEGADARNLGEGGGYASVSFLLEGGASISIGNLQRTRLSGHWQRFWESHIRDEIEVDEPISPKGPVEPVKPDNLVEP